MEQSISLEGIVQTHESIKSDLNDLEVSVKPLRRVNLEKYTGVLKIEEKFFRFCRDILEKPEHGGELPRKYSSLTVENIKQVLSNPTTPSEEDDSEEGLELTRLQETVQAIENNKKRMAVVRTVEDAENPLGEIKDATLIFVSDDHAAPSFAKESIRAQAFRRYVDRAVLDVPD